MVYKINRNMYLRKVNYIFLKCLTYIFNQRHGIDEKVENAWWEIYLDLMSCDFFQFLRMNDSLLISPRGYFQKREVYHFLLQGYIVFTSPPNFVLTNRCGVLSDVVQRYGEIYVLNWSFLLTDRLGIYFLRSSTPAPVFNVSSVRPIPRKFIADYNVIGLIC